jgi:hypothetical protein
MGFRMGLRAWRIYGLQLGLSVHLATRTTDGLLPTRASCGPPSTKHQLSCGTGIRNPHAWGGHAGDLDQDVLPVNKPEIGRCGLMPIVRTHRCLGQIMNVLFDLLYSEAANATDDATLYVIWLRRPQHRLGLT